MRYPILFLLPNAEMPAMQCIFSLKVIVRDSAFYAREEL